METSRLQGSTASNQVIMDDKRNADRKVESKGYKDNTSKSSGVVHAGNLNLVGQQNTLRELFAKKAAWKVQEDQWKEDQKMDDILKEHAARRDSLQKEAGENLQEVNRLDQLKDEMKEAYGVADDSQEQKDLELLEKQVKEEPLTEAELEQIKNIGPLTDYQKAALEYTSMAKIFQDRADEANEDATNEDRTIGAIKLELLKSSPMVEAKQEAEEIMKQVDNEIQKAIVEELKKKISDNLDIDPSDQILLDPKSLIQQKKVAEEDLKGLSVDETV